MFQTQWRGFLRVGCRSPDKGAMLFVFNSDAEREAWAAFPAVKAVLDTTPLRTYLEWAVDDGARFYLPVLAPEESLHWVPCLHKREARGWSAERGRAGCVCGCRFGFMDG